MSLSKGKFPITLKNTTKNRRVVGGLWFAPNGELVVSKSMYENSKEYIHYSLDKGSIVVADEAKEDVVKVKDIEHKKEEVVEQDIIQEGNYSIVDSFVDKNVHWTAVRKYVDELDDLKELESLLIDAQFHDLTEDSVIVKSINDRISILHELEEKK